MDRLRNCRDPGAAKKDECLLGKRQRGRLTSLPERLQLVERFNHAVASGARKAIASAEIGLSLRSLQR